MMKVLDNGHWMIYDVPIFLQKWCPGVNLTKIVHNKVPVWVKIYNPPLETWSLEGISRIASGLGVPLDMDSYTEEMCVHGTGRCAYARVLIELSADLDWENNIEVQTWNLQKDELVSHSLEVEYSWKPHRCSDCKVYGHNINTCPNKVVEQTNNVQNNEENNMQTNNLEDGFTLVTTKRNYHQRKRGRSRGARQQNSQRPHVGKSNNTTMRDPMVPENTTAHTEKGDLTIPSLETQVNLRKVTKPVIKNSGIPLQNKFGSLQDGPEDSGNVMEDRTAEKMDADVEDLEEIEEIEAEPPPIEIVTL